MNRRDDANRVLLLFLQYENLADPFCLIPVGKLGFSQEPYGKFPDHEQGLPSNKCCDINYEVFLPRRKKRDVIQHVDAFLKSKT